jgi:hypothetical protein
MSFWQQRKTDLQEKDLVHKKLNTFLDVLYLLPKAIEDEDRNQLAEIVKFREKTYTYMMNGFCGVYMGVCFLMMARGLRPSSK